MSAEEITNDESRRAHREKRKQELKKRFFEFDEEARAHVQIDACESLKSFNRTTKHCPVVAALLFYILSRGSVTMYQQSSSVTE